MNNKMTSEIKSEIKSEIQINVLIESGKEHFSSNRAVERFKKDIRMNDVDTLDHMNYLKEGFSFKVVKEDNNIRVNVVSTVEELKEQKRKELRQRLHSARYNRSGEARRKLETVKRSVPDKLYKSYVNLLRTAGGSMDSIPSPDMIVNNIDKYRPQVSAVMGAMGNVSNDNKVSNAIKHYFNTIGNMFGIEPMNTSIGQMNEPVAGSDFTATNMAQTNTSGPDLAGPDLAGNLSSPVNSDTEDEEAPELV